MIFVFGSNLAGRHGKGAALYARQHFGTIYKQNKKLQENAYAIPTRDKNIITLPIEEIAIRINRFKHFASSNPKLSFYITPIGTGLAGYKQEEIKPLFGELPVNCTFSKEWNI